MKLYLNIDENNYLLSVATVGNGIEADFDIAEYDLTGDRIRAHKWENGVLVFDAEKYAEIEAEKEAEKETQRPETQEAGVSVYDELAAAYRQGVQEA